MSLRMPHDDIRFCRKCGTKLFNDSEYCHHCGTKVTPDPPLNLPSENKTNVAAKPSPTVRKKNLSNSTIIIGIIVILSLLTFTFTGKYIKSFFFDDISLNEPSTLHLKIGGTHELDYETNADSSQIEWVSSNRSIVTVNSSGKVVAKGLGTATVSAKINGIKKASCTFEISASPVYVSNGQILISPAHTDYPEVTINAPYNSNCYAYFENMYDSSKDFAFYISANSSATVNAPVGTYRFYYAAGDTWYGLHHKFGENTVYYKSPDLITLEEDSQSYDVLELTLYNVSNGNFETDIIDKNQFPG